MLIARISLEFLKRVLTVPSWSEIAFGYERQLISPKVVIEYAMERIGTADEPSDDEVAIASASVDDSIIEHVRNLTARDVTNNENALCSQWANILFAWIYEHRNQIDDPLGLVEEVYADFNYPEELHCFVRYVPSDAPDLGSVEANEQRMIAAIGEYVEQFIVANSTRRAEGAGPQNSAEG